MTARYPNDSNQTILLTRQIATNRHTAFEAFTDPIKMSVWFTTQAKADLRVGGTYENADGDRGKFTIIEPPSRIQFTWENAEHCPGTIVEITFVEESSGQIAIRLEHSLLKSDTDAAEMRDGWNWALDSFKSYLETGTAITNEDWMKRRAES